MPDNGTDRLTQMQNEMRELRTDVNILLRAQVLQTGEMRDGGSRLDRIEKGIEELVESGKQLDERIFKMINGVVEMQNHTDAQIKELREAQSRTDAQISRLATKTEELDHRTRPQAS